MAATRRVASSPMISLPATISLAGSRHALRLRCMVSLPCGQRHRVDWVRVDPCDCPAPVREPGPGVDVPYVLGHRRRHAQDWVRTHPAPRHRRAEVEAELPRRRRALGLIPASAASSRLHAFAGRVVRDQKPHCGVIIEGSDGRPSPIARHPAVDDRDTLGLACARADPSGQVLECVARLGDPTRMNSSANSVGGLIRWGSSSSPELMPFGRCSRERAKRLFETGHYVSSGIESTDPRSCVTRSNGGWGRNEADRRAQHERDSNDDDKAERTAQGAQQGGREGVRAGMGNGGNAGGKRSDGGGIRQREREERVESQRRG